jgi:hypothetical protein
LIGLLLAFCFLGDGNPSGVTNSDSVPAKLPLRPGLSPNDRITANLEGLSVEKALAMYAELTGRTLQPRPGGWAQAATVFAASKLSYLGLMKPPRHPSSGITIHADGLFTVIEVKEQLENFFRTNGIILVPDGTNHFRVKPFVSPS